jgi:prevent-host-death family protein
MRRLTEAPPPNQIEQRTTLVSHLTIITDLRRILQSGNELFCLEDEMPGVASWTLWTECGYNGHMNSVNIAELKNGLSAYLQKVRAGEEIIIRDRNLPVAKLVPLGPTDASAEELALAASGELLLPSETLNERGFWSIGAAHPVSAEIADAIGRAVSLDREERDAGLLGR